MHFALPPRKTSQTPIYARPSRTSPATRLRRLKFGASIACSVVALIYILLKFFGSSEEWRPAGTPEVVIVTVFDHDKMSKEYVGRIKENREDYARRHGYANFFTNTSSYSSFTTNFPNTWSLIPAVRHALALHPHTPWIFGLSPHALIMDPSLSLRSHVLHPRRLASLMLKDLPVVPPDSVIHTFSHLKPEKVDFVLTQDAESLSHGSFLIRKGDWANFFLDSWGDLLYRKYNFQKAEKHALEHIVQWHPTILAKLVLIPQRTINAYSQDLVYGMPEKDDKDGKKMPPAMKKSSVGTYHAGDFLVRFEGCEFDEKRICEGEMKDWWVAWKKRVEELDGKSGALEREHARSE